jgi:carnitine O-acetyltransferase
MPIPVVGAEAEASLRPSNSGNSFMKAVHAAGILPRNGPDPTARSWGHHPSGRTFAAQDKLPKLPVPTLESSCRRYLEALKPLQSAQEHEASATAVQTFLQGEGPILQAQLKEYDRSQANYFEHFCQFLFLI